MKGETAITNVEIFICLDFAVKSQRGTGGRKARTCANTGEKIVGSGAFKWYERMNQSLDVR